MSILTISKPTYNPHYLLYKYEPFAIVGQQTNDILMLANNIFTIIEKKAIKTAKFMSKKQACHLPKTPIQFKDIWI